MTNLPKNSDQIYNNKQAVNSLRFMPGQNQKQQIEEVDDLEDVEYVISEGLESKITKIGASLESITNTLQIMHSRIENNEKLLDGIVGYFSEKYGEDMEEELYLQINGNEDITYN